MSHNTISVNANDPDRDGDIDGGFGEFAGTLVSNVNLSASGNAVTVGDYMMIIYDLYCDNYQNGTYSQEQPAGATAPKSNANYSASWILKKAGYYWFECVFTFAGMSSTEECDIQLKDNLGNTLGPKALVRGSDNTYRLCTAVTGLFEATVNMEIHAEVIRSVGSYVQPNGQNYFPYLELRYIGA